MTCCMTAIVLRLLYISRQVLMPQACPCRGQVAYRVRHLQVCVMALIAKQ